MPDLPQANGDLTTLVPQGLLRRLKAHFGERIGEAVQRYRYNDADEDSLTGALGHALSTPERIVTVANGVTWSFAVESYKIRGKGPGAPERRTGADGIFQVSVHSNGKPIFEKGLPFQAKKLSRYRESEVALQTKQMLRTAHTGIVLRFGPEEYDAADARRLAHEGSVGPDVAPTVFTSLEAVLGDQFLQCQIGKVGLSFDRDERDPTAAGERGFWVIDTLIQSAVNKRTV